MVLSELLIQSVNDVIRVFPAWPGPRDARFRRLRTQSGFLVSSSFVDGKIDVPVGDEEGTRLMFGLDIAHEPFDTRFSYEKRNFDGMSANQAYFSNYGLPLEDPDTPLLACTARQKDLP